MLLFFDRLALAILSVRFISIHSDKSINLYLLIMKSCDRIIFRTTIHSVTLLEEVAKNMPNIKSAKKRVLVARARNIRNKSAKSELRTFIKKFDAAVSEGNRETAESTYKIAVKTIDQAAAKGLIHKNNAARKKSGLTVKLNRLAR